MSRLATSFVLGYHGCDKDVASRAIAGELELLKSEKPYDWLGPGIYFWESDPQRAMEWAKERAATGKIKEPAAIGAIINLKNCLDLVSREDLELLRESHENLRERKLKAGLPMPVNRPTKDSADPDNILRYLDCAVIKNLHDIISEQPADQRVLEPYDTVRALFTEGSELYPKSSFKERTHTQISVITPSCILGLFWPRPYPAA